MTLTDQFWFGKYNSANFEELDVDHYRIKDLEDRQGNIIQPNYFYLYLFSTKKQRADKSREIMGSEKFECKLKDILGESDMDGGYIINASPHLKAMLFSGEYTPASKKNGAPKDILLYRAVITPARLKVIKGPQHLAIGTRTGREDIFGKPLIETFIMRRIY